MYQSQRRASLRPPMGWRSRGRALGPSPRALFEREISRPQALCERTRCSALWRSRLRARCSVRSSAQDDFSACGVSCKRRRGVL